MGLTIELHAHPTYPHLFVTEDGQVFERLVETSARYRYVTVHGRRGGQPKRRSVHQIVCEAFYGLAPSGHEVCHHNGDRYDNRATNLRWGTRLENMADAVAHGTTTRGARNGSTKLTEDDVRAIRQRCAAGDPAAMIAADYPISASGVKAIRSGRIWAWLPEQNGEAQP